MPQVEVKDGIATMYGYPCTYDTKDIRSEIESIAEVNQTFNLPSKYKAKLRPSGFWRHVIKISLT